MTSCPVARLPPPRHQRPRVRQPRARRSQARRPVGLQRQRPRQRQMISRWAQWRFSLRGGKDSKDKVAARGAAASRVDFFGEKTTGRTVNTKPVGASLTGKGGAVSLSWARRPALGRQSYQLKRRRSVGGKGPDAPALAATVTLAIYWIQNIVNVIKLVPKLPVHVRTHKENFDRNQCIGDMH